MKFSTKQIKALLDGKVIPAFSNQRISFSGNTNIDKIRWAYQPYLDAIALNQPLIKVQSGKRFDIFMVQMGNAKNRVRLVVRLVGSDHILTWSDQVGGDIKRFIVKILKDNAFFENLDPVIISCSKIWRAFK